MRIASPFRLVETSLLFILLTASGLAQPSRQTITSQAIRNHFDHLYQADPELISGNFYQDVSPKSTSGHPFYGDKEWQTGSVVLGNGVSDSLILRYDICNNELICNTLNITDSHLPLCLNKKHISSFTLGGRSFMPYPSPGQEKEIRFCEVLAKGPVTLLLLQSKSLRVPMGGNTSFSYETFSKLALLVKGELIDYKGRKTLYRLFPQQKVSLRDYIRTERLRFFGKNMVSHARLVNYCNTLVISTE